MNRISFLLFIFIFSACSYSKKASTKLYEKATGQVYDIIVVPGVPFENGQWSNTMKGRVYWSKYLYDKGIAKNVMYSGSAVYSPYREAEIMALYGEALGIPKENIYIETEAEHSVENIYYSYKKAKMLGFEKIALASDPFQTRMLKRFVKVRLGPDVGLIPIVVDSLTATKDQMIDPTIDYKDKKVDNFVSIVERESFRTRFRGTRGKDLDTTLYTK